MGRVSQQPRSSPVSHRPPVHVHDAELEELFSSFFPPERSRKNAAEPLQAAPSPGIPPTLLGGQLVPPATPVPSESVALGSCTQASSSTEVHHQPFRHRQITVASGGAIAREPRMGAMHRWQSGAGRVDVAVCPVVSYMDPETNSSFGKSVTKRNSVGAGTFGTEPRVTRLGRDGKTKDGTVHPADRSAVSAYTAHPTWGASKEDTVAHETSEQRARRNSQRSQLAKTRRVAAHAVTRAVAPPQVEEETATGTVARAVAFKAQARTGEAATQAETEAEKPCVSLDARLAPYRPPLGALPPQQQQPSWPNLYTPMAMGPPHVPAAAAAVPVPAPVVWAEWHAGVAAPSWQDRALLRAPQMLPLPWPAMPPQDVHHHAPICV